jgi:2-polyprenyl-3-methyl-5-hydroxy-6-metoxy-1,4-benzoquinol methylase
MDNLKCITCNVSENVVFKFSARANYYNIDQNYDYWFCNDCLVLFRDPFLEIDFNSYDNNYYSFQKISKKEKIKNYLASILFNLFYYTGIDLRKNDDILNKTFKILKIKKNAKILDIGCGNGHFLLRLKTFGYKKILGYEPYLKEKDLEINIFNKDLNYLNGYYDFINVNHVIEHVNNPIDFLKNINRLLSFQGIAVVCFPKYGRMVEIDNEHSYLVQAPDHIALYTEKSFEILCLKAKLKILSKTIDSSGTFNWLVMGALWKKGIYAKSFHKNLLLKLNKNEINNLKNISKDIIKRNHGSNLLYVLQKN